MGDSAVVAEEFLIRLNAQVGQTLRLGGRNFRIAAVLKQEPDRITRRRWTGAAGDDLAGGAGADGPDRAGQPGQPAVADQAAAASAGTQPTWRCASRWRRRCPTRR